MVVALLLVVAGLYGLSGAGLIRRLPLLRTGLIVVGIMPRGHYPNLGGPGFRSLARSGYSGS